MKPSERVDKLIEFLQKLYNEYVNLELYIHFRFIEKEKDPASGKEIKQEKQKWYKIGNWEKIRNSLIQKYAKQETEKNPDVILIMYNPTKLKSKNPRIVQYLQFDVEPKDPSKELTKEDFERLKETKPYVVISSGRGVHLLYKLEKPLGFPEDLNKIDVYNQIFVNKIREILPECKVEHYHPSLMYRAPYSLNLKYDPPRIPEPIYINEQNVWSFEKLDKELESLKTQITIKQISKWEHKISKIKLNQKDIPKKLREAIINLFEDYKLARPGFAQYPLLFLSSVLIKGGYKFDQIRELIIEIQDKIVQTITGEERARKTIDYLVNQIIRLEGMKPEEIRNEIIERVKRNLGFIRKEEELENFIEKLKARISTIDDKDLLISLYAKLVFPGTNYIEKLYSDGEITEEEKRIFIKIYRLVIGKKQILKDGSYPIREYEGSILEAVSYRKGRIYKWFMGREGAIYEYIIPKHFRIYVTKAKEIVYGSDIKYVLTIVLKNIETKKVAFYEGDIEHILEKLSKKFRLSDTSKRYINYLLLHCRFTKERGYDKIGLVYDEIKGKFIPTYFGYEKYANVKYLLNEQQLSFLEDQTTQNIEKMIRKLRKTNDLEPIRLSLKYLHDFFTLALDNEDYWLNVTLLFGYLIGSIALVPINDYLGTVYPFMFLYDNGMGGTGKSTALQIFAKILFNIREIETIELLKSLPRIRTLSSLFNIPIIVDEITEKSLDKDVITLIRAIATGTARSIRLKGTSEVETFELKAPFVFSANFKPDRVEGMQDVASSDRFIFLEFKTRFRETTNFTYIKSRVEIDKIRSMVRRDPKITMAHTIFDDIANILNEEYTIEKIVEELETISFYMENILNYAKKMGLAIAIFGLRLWNRIVEKYPFKEKPIFNVDEIIQKVKKVFSKEERRYDLEFSETMRKLALAIKYGILPYYDATAKEKISGIIKEFEEVEFNGKTYKGKYYLIDPDLYSLVFAKDRVAPTEFNKFKRDLYEKIKQYNLASDDETLFHEGRIKIRGKRAGIGEERYDIRSPLLIKEEVFNRFLEGEGIVKFPEIDYFKAIEMGFNDSCPICEGTLAGKQIVFVVDKFYHKDCVMKNLNKIIEEYKAKLKLKSKDYDEIIDYLTSVSFENLLKAKKEEVKEEPEEKPKEEEPMVKTEEEQSDDTQVETKEEKEVEEEAKDETIEFEAQEENIEEANMEDVFPGLKESEFKPEDD